MKFVWHCVLVFSTFGVAITYLYFLSTIRKNSEKVDADIDNLFILKFIPVYKAYIKVRKVNELNNGYLFYLHFIFLLLMVILSMVLDL